MCGVDLAPSLPVQLVTVWICVTISLSFSDPRDILVGRQTFSVAVLKYLCVCDAFFRLILYAVTEWRSGRWMSHLHFLAQSVKAQEKMLRKQDAPSYLGKSKS